MRFRRRRWFFRWTAIAFAITAFAAPAAQAVIPASIDAGVSRQQPAAKPSVPATGATDGFSWADAGVGAAAAFSLVLLAGGGVLVVRGSRGSGLANA